LIEKAGEVVFDAQCIPMNAALLDVPNYKTFLRKRREFIAQRLNEFLGTSRLSESPGIRSDGALPFGCGSYCEPNAVANANGYAMHDSRSVDAVIRVYDEAGQRN
jgi:hypothetical protein